CSSNNAGSRSISSAEPPPTRWYRRITTPGTTGRSRSAAADADFMPRRMTELARGISRILRALEPAVAHVVVQLTRPAPVEAQQHVERGEDERPLTVEETEVAEGLERERVQDREHPAIEEERHDPDVPQRRGDRSSAQDREPEEQDPFQRCQLLEEA